MTYDINELRIRTYQYEKDDKARIPCPDCSWKNPLAIAEDQPYVAALLNYCPLCDGERHITKARALAVLPYIAKYVQQLKSGEYIMAKQKVNWKKVWKEFEDWSYNMTKNPPTCKACGQKQLICDPSWELQQKEIEELLYERGIIVNWHEIWAKLDMWLAPFECECAECHQLLQDFPEWSDQQDKIEQFVDIEIGKQK